MDYKDCINNDFFIGKITKKNNAEPLFFIPESPFLKTDLNAKINNIVYNIKFKAFSTYTIVELPNELTYNVDDVILFGYFNNETFFKQPILTLPKCNNNIVKEIEDGTCYYTENHIDIFPNGEQNCKLNTVALDLMITPTVLSEYLFATVDPTLLDNCKIILDVYLNSTIFKKNVTMFSDEWVAINYQLYLNDQIENVYYYNIKKQSSIDYINRANNTLLNTKIYFINNFYWFKYIKFNLNQYIMNKLQSDIDVSVKLIENSNAVTLTKQNFVKYKKYKNIYNYTELKNNMFFDNNNIYNKIVNNINQNGFTPLELYENSTGQKYTRTCVGQSENGQYNYPNETLYLMCTSLVVYDSTIPTTILYENISMLIQLECQEDSTTYIVQNSFLLPINFSTNINVEILKMANDNCFYYCDPNINCMIDINNKKILYQSYIDSTAYEYDLNYTKTYLLLGAHLAYKYAPMLYDNQFVLYKVPDYIETKGANIQGSHPIVYEYNKIQNLTDPTINKKMPPLLTNLNSVNNILFNTNKTEIFLQLNKNVQYNNYENNKLLDINDENTIVNQNGTSSVINDVNQIGRLKNKLYFNIHNVFNKHVIALLNIECTYDNSNYLYDTTTHYDFYNDSLYLNNILNNNSINELLSIIHTNEILYVLMSKNTIVAENTEFDNYPQNITLRILYEEDTLTIDYPDNILNMTADVVNYLYIYKYLMKFKIDYLNNIFHVLSIQD